MVQFDNMEVWFQRASDVVRRLRAEDVDLGILGKDMFTEYGEVTICQIYEPHKCIVYFVTKETSGYSIHGEQN
jgi:ATP phosphoribosyltransferase